MHYHFIFFSGTPDGQQINDQESAAANNGYHHMNNNNLVANSSSVADTKPSTEHLMNSISSLSAYAGLPTSAKRLPEGKTENYFL